MKKLISATGYLWAIACLLIVPVTFIANDSLALQLSRMPFMKIHPRYSGGEVLRTYESNGMKIRINRPVFDALLGESKIGFVQVTFTGTGRLPENIRESIDYNGDGEADFTVYISTVSGNTELTSHNPLVKSLDVSSRLKEDWVVRVNIEQGTSKSE